MEHPARQVVIAVGKSAAQLAIVRELMVNGVAVVLQSEDLRNLEQAFKDLSSRTGELIIDEQTALLIEHQRNLGGRLASGVIYAEMPMKPVEKKKMPFYHHKRRF